MFNARNRQSMISNFLSRWNGHNAPTALELHSLWIIAAYPRACICCCLSDQEWNNRNGARGKHTHTHTTMHFTCQPEAAFWPIFLWQTVLNHLCKQQSRRLDVVFFLVYLLSKSDTNLCHTLCYLCCLI